MAQKEEKKDSKKQGESKFHLVYMGPGANEKEVSKEDFLACLEVIMRGKYASEASKKRAAPILLSQIEASQ